jgi:hypothetical protein
MWRARVLVFVFNATFNNISVILFLANLTNSVDCDNEVKVM